MPTQSANGVAESAGPPFPSEGGLVPPGAGRGSASPRRIAQGERGRAEDTGKRRQVRRTQESEEGHPMPGSLLRPEGPGQISGKQGQGAKEEMSIERSWSASSSSATSGSLVPAFPSSPRGSVGEVKGGVSPTPVFLPSQSAPSWREQQKSLLLSQQRTSFRTPVKLRTQQEQLRKRMVCRGKSGTSPSSCSPPLLGKDSHLFFSSRRRRGGGGGAEGAQGKKGEEEEETREAGEGKKGNLLDGGARRLSDARGAVLSSLPTRRRVVSPPSFEAVRDSGRGGGRWRITCTGDFVRE